MKRFLFFVLITATFAASQGTPQSSRTRRQKGPRAIAVVRWQADEKLNGHPVLLPVAIIDEGKVYDAAVYKTSPEPMAIASGTVYEAQHHGLPVGLFTIGTASRSNAEGRPWIALGKWKLDLFSPKEGKNVHQATVIVGDPKAQSSELPSVQEGELHRKSTQVYDEAGRPIDKPADDQPPTLAKNKKPERLDRRPTAVPAPPEKPKEGTPTAKADDPDRPRLKRGASTSTPAGANPSTPPKAEASAGPASADPNRPRLKRGKPTGDRVETDANDSPIAKEVLINAAVTRPRTYEMAAVSDADLSGIVQDYAFKASLAERQTFLRKMEELVDAELKPTVKSKSAEVRSPLRRARPADPSRFADLRFEIFDVDSNNSPEIVLTGAYVFSATQRTPFTLVARGDYEGNPHKLLFEKTDRFELIDAVDLEGDGLGDLLFRQITANGPVFVLYRFTPDGLSQVFRGGTAE
jgi:hypothetical protein